jgi:hypothetical protein
MEVTTFAKGGETRRKVPTYSTSGYRVGGVRGWLGLAGTCTDAFGASGASGAFGAFGAFGSFGFAHRLPDRTERNARSGARVPRKWPHGLSPIVDWYPLPSASSESRKLKAAAAECCLGARRAGGATRVGFAFTRPKRKRGKLFLRLRVRLVTALSASANSQRTKCGSKFPNLLRIGKLETCRDSS